MKNMKRAYRRGKAYYAFMRRFKKWTCKFDKSLWDEQFKKEGERWRWMKSTGKPCSCEGCSPTYKRPQRQYWLNNED